MNEHVPPTFAYQQRLIAMNKMQIHETYFVQAELTAARVHTPESSSINQIMAIFLQTQRCVAN